jgi:putative peptidoglycan lipid II flippase
VGVNYAGFILDTAFASTARETAALPAINNAWLLVGLPIALLGQAVGQSAFPRLAAHAAAGEWRTLRQTLLRSLGAAVALAIPALLGMLLLGRLTIQILFEHGKYDAAAGALTYAVLVPYSVGLPFFVGTEVITRGLIALRDTRTPLITNTLQLVGRGALMALLVGAIGVVAIPLAFVVSASVETLALAAVLLVKLQRRLGRVAPGLAAATATAAL